MEGPESKDLTSSCSAERIKRGGQLQTWERTGE